MNEAPLPLWFPQAVSFCFGACVASFLNVVIWRVPRGESIVSPPSHCPKCGAAIKWWRNIPVISWLALRGKCADCRAPISPRYMFVELLGGLLFLAAYLRLSGPEGAIDPYAIPQLLVWWAWIALMIAGSFIDFDHQVLPDFATQGGMVLGFAHAGAELFRRSAAGEQAAAAAGDAPFWFLSGPFADAVAGLAVGFGLMWLVRKAGTAAFKREAMGEGDVWLMGAVGAMFGPVAAVATLVVSSLIGSVAGLGLVLLGRTKLGRFAEIPFGPYICMACLAWMFRGPELWRWYRGLVLG